MLSGRESLKGVAFLLGKNTPPPFLKKWKINITEYLDGYYYPNWVLYILDSCFPIYILAMTAKDNSSLWGFGTTKTFKIPIEHLDFKYIEKCSDVKHLEKILCVLR